MDAVAERPDAEKEFPARYSNQQRPSHRTQKAKPVTLATLNDVGTMFTSLLNEYAYWVDDAWVTGTIPPELHGTYYRNGPALHVTNPRYRRHTLDGDGMVFSLAFRDGRAYFRNRFVRTQGFLEEQAAGRPLHRNSFTRGAVDGGRLFNPFDLRFKNVANTGVLPWAGQLYALWEAGLPHLMDPRTLDTLRESRMGGQIRGNTFSAHYHIVTEADPSKPQQPQQPQQATLQRATQPPSHTDSLATAQRQKHDLEHPQHHEHHRANGHQHGHANGHQHANGHASHHAVQQRLQGAFPPLPSVLYTQRFEREHVSSASRHVSDAADGGVREDGHQACASAGAASSTCRRLVTFSNEFGFGGARAVFYEFEESGRLLHETEHVLPGIDVALIHDMLVTEHYYILVVGPIKLDPVKFATQYVLGGCSIAECLVFDDQQPARVMLFPRPGRPSKKVLPVRVLTADPFFVFHNVNGFEVAGPDGEVEQVVLDTVAWDEVAFDLMLFDKRPERAHLDGFNGGARAQLTRLICNLRTGRVERRKLLQRTVEFPKTDPRVTSRPHRVAWFITDAVDDPVLWGPAQSILRVELDPSIGLERSAPAVPAAAPPPPLRLAPPRPAATAARGSAAGAAPGVAVDQWHFGDRCFPGEPMFVPRPGSTREGDGWLIVGVHDAATEKGDVHIFDAEALSSGPLATIHLPHRLPLSLHGAWDAAYMGPDPQDAAVPRWHQLGSVRPM